MQDVPQMEDVPHVKSARRLYREETQTSCQACAAAMPGFGAEALVPACMYNELAEIAQSHTILV